MDQIARRLVVTFWRATMIGLRRKNILTYLPTSGRPHDGYVAEGLCSPIRKLEKAVVRLQQDIADYRYWDSVQTTVEAPAPTPEVPAVEKLLQRLVTNTQSRPRPVVSPPAPTELEQLMRPFFAEQRRRRQRSPAMAQAIGAGDNHAVDKLLQQLGTETQSCSPPVVSPPTPI